MATDAIRLIKNKSPAIRTEVDIDLIRTTFDGVLGADPVWAILSTPQKNCLCKHFEFKAALSEGGDLYPCVEKTAVRQHALDNSLAGLFILLRGDAKVSLGPHSIVIHGRDGFAVLGRLPIPEDVPLQSDESNASLYHRFVALARGCMDVSVQFFRGASYIHLPILKSRPFIEKLNASLLTRRMLVDIGMSGLLQCEHRMSDNGISKVFQFRPGTVLIKQGSVANRVLFIAKGSCFIFRSANKHSPPLCVGSLSSPSFIGFSPLLGEDNDENFGIHPVSVVAVEVGFAYSLCSRQFLSIIKQSTNDLVQAFTILADCQKIWIDAADEYYADSERDELDTVEEDTEKPVEYETEEQSNKNDINIADLISNIGNGKLQRTKMLTALHGSLIEEKPHVGEDLNDLDHPLLQSISKNLLKEIMTNLERDCGVTFGCCNEGHDPFHNFSIYSDNAEAQMTLLMPTPVPGRLACMADNFLGLGRKRHPKYDDSDPFLMPVPSAVDRKMHGKTLPIIRRAKGSIDPVVYNEKEWV